MPDVDRRGSDDLARLHHGRLGPTLTYEGRVPADPMNSPLNPEREPAQFAAVRA
jgi:hypothetical protein